MAQRQRLVVCLDGTWNTQDDSTNVFHHFSMVQEGEIDLARGGKITQRKEYIPGVGTGALDSITGGGFGLGLEENVRRAYNWLVQNYNDGSGNGGEPDEIYIFGFSRGAYTARSLVGFIGSCGLLKRGAPLTVNQLWKNYCVLGRRREERQSIWELLIKEADPECRPIRELTADPWSKRKATPGELKESEHLLVAWSRRVKITYLGIYDTVGAMGLDALAIPGLTSKLAMHHNLRPTTLIHRCRHALAMDEHRVSFRHNPFIQYVGHRSETSDGSLDTLTPFEEMSELEKPEETAQFDKTHEGKPMATLQIEKARVRWRRKIEQRWFVGAHSNVGGGYPDNVLAQVPLRWLFEGARQAETSFKDGKPIIDGLHFESCSDELSGDCADIVDSYQEFAKPFWTMVIRGKRYYRQIDPDAERRAARWLAGKPRVGCGFSLQSINEKIDPTVFNYWRNSQEDIPPNLVEYARRKYKTAADPDEKKQLEEIAKRNPRHAWMNNAPPAYAFLVLWTTLIAIGLEVMNHIFRGKFNYEPLPGAVLLVGAFLFSIIDWAESKVNFVLALKPTTAPGRAFLDSIYWTRSLGFVLFVFGAGGGLSSLWLDGWSAAGNLMPWRTLWENVFRMVGYWWPMPVCAGVGMIAAAMFEDFSFNRLGFAVKAFFKGAIATLALIPATMGLGWIFGRIFAPIFGLPQESSGELPLNAGFAGLLLFLEVTFIYVARAFVWTGEPMAKANLGSIVKLQFCVTPKAVMDCLEQWRLSLACDGDEADKDKYRGPAAAALRDCILQSLWRDIIGFIPTYAFAMYFALWFASDQLDEKWLKELYWGIPLWALIPSVAMLADYLEDVVHLHFLARHAGGTPPAIGFTLAGVTMATIKFIAFLAGTYLSWSALLQGVFQLAIYNKETGWRGSLALFIPTLAVSLLVAGVAGALLFGAKKTTKFRSRGSLVNKLKAA